MGTMNISLPDGLKDFVDEQIADGGYATSSEYVRDLIRKERARQQLRSLLLEGAASELLDPIDDSYFEELKARARRPAAE